MKISKVSPREFCFPLLAINGTEWKKIQELIRIIEEYVDKRKLEPERCEIKTQHNGEGVKYCWIIFSNIYDSFAFEIYFGTDIKQEYTNYG